MKKRVMTEQNLSVIHFDNNKVPETLEVKGKDWISYGIKNDYPEYLISLFERSAKHNAIITGKIHYIKGNGIEVDTDGMTIEQQAKLLNWYKNLSSCGSSDLLSKVITDVELFNGCYLEVIPNRMGTGIAEVNHIGFEKIRVSKNKDGYFYSNDWSNYRQSFELTGLKFIPFYDASKYSGLYRYKSYRPGKNIYPVPEYIGCISYIEVDYEIANFHLNNIKHGFVGGTMISFNNGTPLPEEQKVIEQKVKGKFTGTDKAGQMVITFSDNKDSAPTVTPLLPNNFDKVFIQLNDTVMQEIFTGHKITSLSLFGIKEANGLGSKDELKNAFELFQNGYINAKQNIVEGIFNDLAESQGYGRPFEIIPISPITDGIDQADVIKVMTTDEIRSKAGLPLISKETSSTDTAVLNALNSVSPLVATKVLETMTVDEIRKLVGLSLSNVAMHSHEYGIENFKKCGVNKSDYKIYKTVGVENRQEVILNEIIFHKDKFLDIDLIIPKILDLINGNPNITVAEISKTTGESKADISTSVNKMLDLKLITGTIGQTVEITEIGQNKIAETPVENIQILYSYEERENLPPLLTESREFCQELMDLNKLYTREEIDLISAAESRDVWATRGGYFHNTKLKQTTPYCRHVWSQNIVRKK